MRISFRTAVAAALAVSAVAFPSFAQTQPLKVHSLASLEALQRRAVIPVAGSLRAADGSQFKTSLRLTGLLGTNHTYSGRIIFHPQGQPISDDDPSLPYSLSLDPTVESSLYWDDVVAAMGQTGLGTLDIVPDADGPAEVPLVDARVYNDIGGRINGSREEALRGADVFNHDAKFYTLPMHDLDSQRVNVGIRTFGDPGATVILDVFVQGVSAVYNHVIRTIPANMFVQYSLGQLTGITVEDGQEVRVAVNIVGQQAHTSDAFLYFTRTENSTNDPTVIVPKVNITGGWSVAPASN